LQVLIIKHSVKWKRFGNLAGKPPPACGHLLVEGDSLRRACGHPFTEGDMVRRVCCQGDSLGKFSPFIPLFEGVGGGAFPFGGKGGRILQTFVTHVLLTITNINYPVKYTETTDLEKAEIILLKIIAFTLSP
jgi:hypothetical protein